MSLKIGKYLLALSALVAFSMPSFVRADSMGSPNGPDDNSNVACPVGLVSGMTLDQEFGAGASALTNCVKKRHDVKSMFQIDRFCGNVTASNAACTSPYALGNMKNALDDYDITDGMKPGIDYKMIAIVYGGGGMMLLKGNKFESQVKAMMARGVKFYLCQNTLRGFIKAGLVPNPVTTGIPASDSFIDGVQYVTAGVTAVMDHEARGWSNISP